MNNDSKKGSKKEFTKAHAKELRDKYPDRIPVIVTVAKDVEIKKNKYLVPLDLTMGQFQYVIRKNTNMKPTEAFFLFVGNRLIETSLLMSVVLELYGKDGFVHVHAMRENTFG